MVVPGSVRGVADRSDVRIEDRLLAKLRPDERVKDGRDAGVTNVRTVLAD